MSLISFTTASAGNPCIIVSKNVISLATMQPEVEIRLESQSIETSQVTTNVSSNLAISGTPDKDKSRLFITTNSIVSLLTIQFATSKVLRHIRCIPGDRPSSVLSPIPETSRYSFITFHRKNVFSMLCSYSTLLL